MPTFEDRVNDAASLNIDDRYKALEKLSPAIARSYVIGINAINEENLRKGRPLEGFGGFAEHDVDDLIDAARAGGGGISNKDEEALVIILVAKTPWKGKAKQHLIEKLELNLKNEWSTSSMVSDVPQLLSQTNKLDFESGGNRHQGTTHQYIALEFQLVAGLIAAGDIGAWELSQKRSYLFLPEGQSGEWGFYDPDANDIYIVDGLTSRDRQCTFVHEVVHAILDVRNAPPARAKFIAADGFISQAFVANALGQPYTSKHRRPEEVASAGASKMLETSMSRRDKKWKSDFKDAYDDVVDAVEALRGTKEANAMVNMLEDQKTQDAETARVTKILAKLKKKRP